MKILPQFKVFRSKQTDSTKYLANKLPAIDQVLFVQFGCLFLREQQITEHFRAFRLRKKKESPADFSSHFAFFDFFAEVLPRHFQQNWDNDGGCNFTKPEGVIEQTSQNCRKKNKS